MLSWTTTFLELSLLFTTYKKERTPKELQGHDFQILTGEGIQIWKTA